MTSLSPTATGVSAQTAIMEVGVQNFMQEVIQASLQVPVLVYFTAAWCGPCKQFGPLLEKVVAGAKGKVKLVKVDVDKSPQLAQQFRIQSVPMIYVFVQGQPLDGFAGAIPESQLKQLIEQIAGAGPEDEMLKATLETAAALVEQGEIEQASQAYKAILAHEPENMDALVGLIKCCITIGQLEQAEQLLLGVPLEKQSAELIVAAKAALELAKSAPKVADLSGLKAAVAKNPKDHQARLDLAMAQFASGNQSEAVDELLASITSDRNWNEGAARAQLLKFFEALGFTHPLSVQGRRKLSSILFS